MILLNSLLFASVSLELTQEEKVWLSKHKEIRHTGDSDWLPFEAFSENGEYIGIIADGLEVIQKTQD
ncbi:MAG: hypothetical protein FAF04_07540 [Epsilonproteobacteria bacterium]|nr:hypothetical protein [Campylobacterota bacterium]